MNTNLAYLNYGISQVYVCVCLSAAHAEAAAMVSLNTKSGEAAQTEIAAEAHGKTLLTGLNVQPPHKDIRAQTTVPHVLRGSTIMARFRAFKV